MINRQFKYSKLLLFLICIVIAYFLSKTFVFEHFVARMGNLYFTLFIAGILLTISFTAPFAIAFFIELVKSTNINLIDASLISGFGALIASILIFEVIRYSIMDKTTRKKGFHSFKTYDTVHKKEILFKIKTYLTITFSGLIFSLPLSSNYTHSMLAGFTEIDRKTFYLISFLLNSIIIFVILLLSSLY